MLEAAERIESGMCSPVLANLVKRFQKHVLCENLLKGEVGCCCLVSHYPHFCWFHNGIAEASSRVIEMSEELVIEADIRLKELLRVNGEEMKAIQHNVVLDLNDDGERWEGDVLDNQPYGWGVLYDSENRMVYEGFRLKDVNVCYGRSYYSDNGVIEYEGEICEGKRWGRGVLYDRSGKTVFDGEWMNDEQLNKRVTLKEENQFIPSCIEELIVSNYRCNGEEWIALDLSFMSHLRLLQMGDNCFENVEEVRLIGLNQLEKVVIGNRCFMMCYYERPRPLNPNGHFYLKNCERLRELKIGQRSFSYYAVCEIENLPSLEVIEMGELNKWSDNFFYASMELKSESDENEVMK